SSSGQNPNSQEPYPSIPSYYSGHGATHTLSALSRNRTFHLQSDSGISSLLPSDSCKYLTWRNIEQHDIRGSQLPHLWFLVTHQTGGMFLTPKKRVPEKNKWEMWLQENWEDCKNLGDPYQVENFNRILRRLIQVETLWLVDNSLVDLSTIRLPSCRILNMSKNHFTSFKQLPKIPQIQYLSLAENHIKTLSGLCHLRCTPLESLTLKRNPCEFHENYRKRVLPNLKMLDGILKLPEDCSPPEHNTFSKLCIIS
uniref:Leucine rich repeat containing 77 n=1 Tax=Nannospalax galili TaxID=1026970 RepID=A0A8C6W828_NANGA